MQFGKRFAACFAAALLLAGPMSASASEAYEGYVYDANGHAVASQIGYQPVVRWTGEDAGGVSSPSDFCFGPDEILYVLDKGNGRVIMLTDDLQYTGVLEPFFSDGEPVMLSEPSGIFVDRDGKLYIADTGNARVLICDSDGVVQQVLERPDTGLIAEDYEFKPTKVLLDDSGYLYVLSTGLYEGALVYDQSYQFSGFFGGNRVAVTLSLLNDTFWKKLMNDETAGLISQYTPEEVTAFDIDTEGFIYTCSISATSGKGQVKKLNSQGKNILNASDFGDLESVYINRIYMQSQFSDIHVDGEGFLFLLDMTYGRIFQYDQEGQLLTVFGGLGERLGTFRSPIAIESRNGTLYVLDTKLGAVTTFESTEFGTAVRTAVSLYRDGLYQQAADAWKTVHAMDINYEMAYQGIGKALMADGDYQQAATYFKLGADKPNNSVAFGFYRTQWMKVNYLWILAGLLSLTAVIVILVRKRHPAAVSYGTPSPIRVLFHPFDSFDRMKQKKHFTWIRPLVSIVLWFIVTMLCQQLLSFRFRTVATEDVNVFLILFQTVVLSAIFIAGNWAVCTLLDGKGRLREIAGVCGHALIPYSIGLLLYTAASYCLTLEEAFFLQLILAAGLVWGVVVLLVGLIQIHEYSFSKLLISLLLTVAAIAVVVFLALLCFGLVQEAYSFMRSLITETLYRISA